MPISHRKSFKYKQNKVVKQPRIGRTELTAVEHAFTIGALMSIRGDYDSQHKLAEAMGFSKGKLTMFAQRVEKEAEGLGVFLWDEILYENDQGRCQSLLLTQEQRDCIISIVTSTRTNCEKES
ncbi:hypothetical protein BU25DRAFT_426074 [Macroventuria anomochaeta]|uniref:Uncharacterized protein n=1 Tax=Macroventuria anomochaeta TaxID=301207 RepID=A0ACB6RJA7_9PLEO|nr:uncharacterized protein BU25DRAFT_426074 [Macroventuria anomochaeta]KAF2621961.1 hypothetical protein BU25DRAFT_426074 [Macroventuria anomochaeta]